MFTNHSQEKPMIRQLTIGGATAAIGLATFFIITAQERTHGQQAGAQAGGFGGGGLGGGGLGGGGIGGGPSLQLFPQQALPAGLPALVRSHREDKVSAAQRKLMEADTDEARQAAEKELREALVAEFDADMQHRAEELEAIKKRVADMEANLEKRTAAKDEIIDLRLEVLLQEAEGLGWSADRRRGSNRPRWGVPSDVPPAPAVIHQH
jgi:hypothetical protein